ncbi:MAG: polysaccharide deacetylase [Micropruina sp.]|nr:polysaccharide deacetylase [Micropruina sp.]
MTDTTSLPRWPDDRASAVGLAFDLDGPTGDAMLDGSLARRPAYFSQKAYGPWRGVDRLLRVLDGLPATFFVPGWVVEHWPRQCRRLVDAGHEVAHHGYRHERFADHDLAGQRAIIERSQAIFAAELGTVATGFRTPSGDWTPGTPGLLADLGFSYSSSMRDDDRPYRHAGADLIEIPARSELDDYTSLAYTRDPDWPAGGARIASYPATLDAWRREASGHHAAGGCLVTLFHPKFVGRPGPARLLADWLDDVRRARPWFATLARIADWARTTGCPVR